VPDAGNARAQHLGRGGDAEGLSRGYAARILPQSTKSSGAEFGPAIFSSAATTLIYSKGIEPLFAEKCRDLAGALPDRGEGIEVTVRPDQRGAFGRTARSANFFQGLADDRLVKDDVVRREKDKRRRLDFCRIDGGELVGFAQIEKMIGIGHGGAR